MSEHVSRLAHRALLIASCVIAAVLCASGQVRDAATAPATGTARISGRVLSDESTSASAPSPARRVTLTLAADGSAARLVAITDDEGRFAFTNLPANRYTLSAAKAGYVPWNYGSKRAGGSGTPIVLADGQRADVALTLIKGGVLTGTVRDERGLPMPDVTVTALRYAVSSQTGERELQAVTIGAAQFVVADTAADAFPGTAVSDDRGVYRIFGLAPGDYIVSASARRLDRSPVASTDIHQVSRADVQRAQQLLRGSGAGAAVAAVAPAGVSDTSRVNYAPMYHPAAIASADATVITLGRSEERSGIDVLVRLVPTATLAGMVTRPDGQPVSNAYLNLVETGPAADGYSGAVRLARSSADGTFAIRGLNPGRYELRSYTYPEALCGVTTVEVAGRDLSTSVVLAPGGTLSGRIVFDGASKPPPATAVIVLIQGLTLPIGKNDRAADGTFVISNILPGRYRLRISGRPPAGWVLRSAMVNGTDASDIPFEVGVSQNIDGVVVTLTDRPAEVSGRFVDAAGTPAPEYVLVVFSADRRRWVPRSPRTQQVRPDANGTFVARDLPAGDYFISAVTDLEDGQVNDPAFLAALAAASPVRITLAEGEKKVQDIRVGISSQSATRATSLAGSHPAGPSGR